MNAKERKNDKFAYDRELGALMTPAFIHAARNGDIKNIRAMLGMKVINVNAQDKEGNTALHTAALEGASVAMLQLLLSHGADVNALNNIGEAPLHRSCVRDQIGASLFLLSHGADVNLVDNAKRSSLYWACLCGSMAIVKALLECGANVNAADDDNWSPLHLACGDSPKGPRGQLGVDLIRLLLSHGADPGIRDNRGRTPLDLFLGHKSVVSACEETLSVFRQYAPETTLESVLKLPPEDPLRERTLDWYREHHPEMVMERYVAGGLGL